MKNAIEILAGLGAVLFLTGCGEFPGSAAEPGFDQQVDQIRNRLATAAAEGASGILRITHRGDVIYESGFGSASCNTEDNVTPNHVFMIGSITKELTRVLGFVLEEKGVFSLDDTVSDLIPEFHGPIGRVSLKQIINHTGGLPNFIDRNGRPVPYSIEYDYESVTRTELVARAGLADLIFEPGRNEEYSNLGYQLLAAVYELTTGESYPDLLRRNIFEPSGMEGTDFWFADKNRRPVADGCLANNVRWGNPIDDAMWGESGPSWNLIGAGGLLSTAESLGHFFDGIGSGVYFETSGQLETYKANRMVFSSSRQQRVMGPAGSNGIFNAVAYWADKDQFNVIVMTNRAEHPAEGDLFRDLIGLFPPDSLPVPNENRQ